MTEIDILKPDGNPNTFNLLIYGDPGAGKTTFSASAQQHSVLNKALFLNIEGGMLSAQQSGAGKIDIENFDHLERIFWELAGGAHPDYRTIIIDSGSDLQALDLEEIVGQASKKDKNRDLDTPYLQDYGKSTHRLRRILRWFRDMDRNLIVTALVKRVYPGDPTTAPQQAARGIQPIAAFPAFTSALSRSVLGYMDFVWYAYVDNEGKHKLLTKPSTSPYVVKTRGANFSVALPTVVDANLPAIMDLLLETEYGVRKDNTSE